MQIIQTANRLHICIIALSLEAWCHGPSHQSRSDHTRRPTRSLQADIALGGVTHPAQVAGLWQPTGPPYLVHLFNCAFDENILSANRKAAVQRIWGVWAGRNTQTEPQKCRKKGPFIWQCICRCQTGLSELGVSCSVISRVPTEWRNSQWMCWCGRAKWTD